jgi:hypothetical protein
LRGLLDDGKEALAQLALGSAAEVLGARGLAALQDALRVLHRHLAHGIDKQLPRLWHRRLGGAVKREDELVRLSSHAEAPHHLLGPLQRLRKRDLHPRVGEKPVGAPQGRDGGSRAFLERCLEAGSRFLACDPVQLG